MPARSRKTEPLNKPRKDAKAPSIRGEKRVSKTDKTLPVAPARRRRGTHDGPTDPRAIDRRKEFVGTDQPADPKAADASRPRKAGGNAGRGAVGLTGKAS